MMTFISSSADPGTFREEPVRDVVFHSLGRLGHATFLFPFHAMQMSG